MQQISVEFSDFTAEIKRSWLKRLLLCFSLPALFCASILSASAVLSRDSRTPASELVETGRAPTIAEAPKSPADIKVVSYNIRWRGGADLDQLVKHLKHDSELAGASIVGLQEVDRNKKRTGNLNTVKAMAEKLGHYYAWAAPPTAKPGKEEETGVAILSSYPLTDVRRIVLPHPGPGRRRRVAIGATVDIAGRPSESIRSSEKDGGGQEDEQSKAVWRSGYIQNTCGDHSG